MSATGHLYVVAAPSGAGKTSLVKALIETTKSLTVSISHTTRAKRPNETNGVNYHFIDKTQFEQMIRHKDFLEHAMIFEQCYGTSKRWVTETLAKGIDVILEIDWQGHQQIKHLLPETISIFILPPSLTALRERLTTRNQDSPDIIQQRLADAKETVTHIEEFDYVVINDNFNNALEDLKAIILATRLQCTNQILLHQELISNLTNNHI